MSLESLTPSLVFSASRAGARRLFRLVEGKAVDTDYAGISLDGATMRIVHPLEMSADELRAWGDHFAEAKMLGPFAQLGRPTYGKGEALVPTAKVPRGTLAGRVRGLGWRNVAAEDAGLVYGATKTFAGRNVRAELSHDGYHVSDNSWTDEPAGLSAVNFTDLRGQPIDEAAVDGIVWSEVAGDLRGMVGE